jgi:hypothetical protein
MPIEIKELHIHVVVNAGSAEQPANKPARTGENNSGNSGAGDKDSIVAECVEQVLEILQNKRER